MSIQGQRDLLSICDADSFRHLGIFQQSNSLAILSCRNCTGEGLIIGIADLGNCVGLAQGFHGAVLVLDVAIGNVGGNVAGEGAADDGDIEILRRNTIIVIAVYKCSVKVTVGNSESCLVLPIRIRRNSTMCTILNLSGHRAGEIGSKSHGHAIIIESIAVHAIPQVECDFSISSLDDSITLSGQRTKVIADNIANIAVRTGIQCHILQRKVTVILNQNAAIWQAIRSGCTVESTVLKCDLGILQQLKTIRFSAGRPNSRLIDGISFAIQIEYNILARNYFNTTSNIVFQQNNLSFSAVRRNSLNSLGQRRIFDIANLGDLGHRRCFRHLSFRHCCRNQCEHHRQ